VLATSSVKLQKQAIHWVVTYHRRQSRSRFAGDFVSPEIVRTYRPVSTDAPSPKRPEDVSPFAVAFLHRLQSAAAAEQFVLGGYFALKHYLDYRQTGDVGAWWLAREDPQALAAARAAFAQTAEELGYTVRERAWGETISLEALDGAKKAFSFQVSARSIKIEEPIRSPWGRFPIETLQDNVASKMVALVARGAPRDFVDIKKVVDAGLVSAARCWELWSAKEPGTDLDDARVRVQTHLARLETRMPIERLPADRQAAAAELRAWYRNEFIESRAGDAFSQGGESGA
jgi:Nucleotidyl transferase AbiEii toxin, Type IV TA system